MNDKTNNRGGRPRHIDKSGSEWGSKTLTLRITPRQMDTLKDDADALAISVGELVRRKVFGRSQL